LADRRADLFLGSDLGLWALGEVSPAEVLRVYTLDPAIAETASARGFEVIESTANEAGVPKGETGLSVHYPVVFKPEFLSEYRAIYNLHPGYLPWGRGFYPVFWAIWEQTPAGATLHEVTSGIDEGPIVAQIQVNPGSSESGGDLHRRVRDAEKAIFRDYWPAIRDGKLLPSRPQGPGGTRHTRKEFLKLKQQAEWRSMRGEDIIRLIRALTFDGFTGLEVELGKDRFHLRLERLKKEQGVR
jgi:methionyl-tRNA formyltransferase